MAFVKKTWKDRIVQYANRRLLTKSGGEVEQVTVTRDEGTISEAGDQFNASNMNDLEQRVKAGFDDLNAADLPITSGSATNTKDYIDSSLSGKQSKIKQETINKTTTSAGLVNLGKKTSDNEYVLSVTAVTNYGGYYCTLSLTTSGEWYANVKQVSDNSSVNNASVAIKVVWCEI